MSHPRLRLTALVAALALVSMTAGAEWDALKMSLEELDQARILSTPKFADNPDAVPSAVSILSAQDIRAFGWRSLGDALRSLQSFNVTNDHTYGYAGVRGISSPNDYRQRMQILIDGISVNENIYSSVPVDNAFPLDLDLVERIEVVRGPSASVYGGDSMFGVINVVTRTSVSGGEAALAFGSGLNRQARLTWGGEVAGIKDLLLSATRFGADGRSLDYPALVNAGLPAQVSGLEAESGEKFLLRARGNDWRATLIHSDRRRLVPNGSYGTQVNDPRHLEADRFTLAEFATDQRINDKTILFNRIYAGEYTYRGDFPYLYGSDYVINRDRASGAWWGVESRLQLNTWQDQRWNVGLELKNNFRQQQTNDDLGYGCYGIGSAPCLDNQHKSRLFTLYVQDEIQITDHTALTLGLRYDHINDAGTFWSPRLGLVQDAGTWGIFKWLYATAFRTPSVYERYYTTTSYLYGNPMVNPEHIHSTEVTWEKHLSGQAKIGASIFAFQAENLISTDLMGIASNANPVRGKGLELEYDRRWRQGAHLRANYTLQSVSGDQGRPDNAPRHMLKFNLDLPTALAGLNAGLEGQWVSSRLAANGSAQVDAYALANLTLRYKAEGAPWETSLSVYNLFNHHYQDPQAPDTLGPVSQWSAPQFGRSILVKGLLHF